MVKQERILLLICNVSRETLGKEWKAMGYKDIKRSNPSKPSQIIAIINQNKEKKPHGEAYQFLKHGRKRDSQEPFQQPIFDFMTGKHGVFFQWQLHESVDKKENKS